MWLSESKRISASLRLLSVSESSTIAEAYCSTDLDIGGRHAHTSRAFFEELQRHGYNVVVLADAVSSTSSQERKLALKRMRDAGISVNSVEGWIFELLRSDNHPVYVLPWHRRSYIFL